MIPSRPLSLSPTGEFVLATIVADDRPGGFRDASSLVFFEWQVFAFRSVVVVGDREEGRAEETATSPSNRKAARKQNPTKKME